MSKPIIEVTNLSKRYTIGKKEAYENLREEIMQTLSAPFKRLSSKLGLGDGEIHTADDDADTLWALKNVSFQVQEGEVIGIIGRNGAGKSTLLKILSRITEPTSGRIVMRGRVASLLEVGTGFHPELTGRENIFLNGALLGMNRQEIKAKFDEIVAFAEIDKFIDTPVKRYSSGMYVRLAFGVAAHMEPEILIIDEVLAVGDAAFQQKCLGKMGDAAKGGRTVLFVSHNMGAVTNLCSSCLLLDNGKILKRGEPTNVIPAYLTAGQRYLDGIITPDMHTNNNGEFYFKKINILDENKKQCTNIFFKNPLYIYIEFEVCQPVKDVRLIVVIEKIDGTLVCACHHPDVGHLSLDLQPGHYAAEIEVPLSLMPGGYKVQLAVKPVPGFWGKGQSIDWVQGAINFFIEEISRDGQATLLSCGVVHPDAKWSIYPL